MKERIVFIHIPKSAGTSLRYKLETIAEPGRVFWWPRNDGTHNVANIPMNSNHWQVVGGHYPIINHQHTENSLYLSIVRDPVMRVLSLFKYLTAPELAVEDVFRQERLKQQEIWIERGVDSASLYKTLEKSEGFRELVSNSQCHFLSRGERTFEGVVSTLSEIDYIIGDFAHIAAFNEALFDRINYQNTPLVNVNSSKKYIEKNGDKLTISAIESLCVEDIKLYNWVNKDCNGLSKNSLQ